MDKSRVESSANDRRGMLIASLCFVHCVAGPVLLSFVGFSSMIGTSEKLEPLFLLGSAGMGFLALVPAYRTKHRRVSCLALFGSGFICLIFRRRIQLQGIAVEQIGVALGAMLIIGAHALNLRFSRRCACCEPGPIELIDAPERDRPDENDRIRVDQ
jgi:MerC mercury resistance protein